MEPPSSPHPQISAPAAAPAPRLSLRLEVAARTNPGLERGSNQDSYLVVEPGEGRRARSGGEPAWAALAVCDGMGGAAGGDVASQLAVDVLRDVMTAGGAPATRDALGRRLLHGVEEAGRRIFAAARANRRLEGMGTTATACALTGDALYVAQVGDSRAYLFRRGRLTQITRDQTLAVLLVEQGQLAPEDVADFPHGHVILQAVGTSERVQVDLTRVQVADGDVILLCSDGLHGPVPTDAIRAVLAGEPSPADACDALIALAIAAGGPDNVTAVVARVAGDDLRPPSGPPASEKARLDEDETVQTAQAVTMSDPPVEAGEAPQRPGGPARVGEKGGEEAALGAIARIAAFFRRRRSSGRGGSEQP